MLHNLHVKNLALIDEIEVDFTEGLNILTGETGAGKSIVLGGINLALGGRYSADMIRKGETFGLVELTFSVDNPKMTRQLEEMGITPEEGMLIISRKLMDGRSICRINGETVTLGLLKNVASVLIDIHGQHEHQSLLYKKNHLVILDAFLKDAREVKNLVKEKYKIYKELLKELSQADTDESERLKEVSFLEFEIEEIQSANLSVEEEEELEDTYRKMSAGKQMAENLEEAYMLTSGNSRENASDLISRGVRSLSDVMELDEKASELYDQLMEIENLLSDFNHELRAYSDAMNFAPEAFYEVENRLNEVNRLKAKYGNTVEQILEYCEEKMQRLEVLRDYDTYIENLKEKLSKAEKELQKTSDVLSQIRKTEAVLMEKEFINGLQELNFLDVQFQIHFEKKEGYASDGTDDVEFMISMNPGEPLKPLSEVASGGELSRIMLALKAVMADKDEIDTLIFDEIDVGISGRTAQKVSEKMALIGKKHQVICITHLAQIAAMADAHYLIKKQVEQNKTTTGITRLTEEEMVHELARILGGVEITETVLQNALEMKKLAKGLKK